MKSISKLSFCFFLNLLLIMSYILQWNIRGLSANYASGLQPLIQSTSPQIICLQETKLSCDDFEINKYAKYHYINRKNLIAAGGTSIFVKKDLLHRQINLRTNLQAIAVRVTSHKPITVCSIYLPPGDTISTDQLMDLHKQLPTPFMILGDFNAHSPLWGEQTQDPRGKIVEDLLSKTNICILNNTSPTYLIPSTLKTTSVDLTLCSPDLASILGWSVLEDTHGSDHFPIIVEAEIPQASTVPLYFNFNKASWPAFSEACINNLNPNTDCKTIELFSETLLNIANQNIPRLSSKPRKNKSWFNDDCRKAVEKKRNKLRAAQNNCSYENIRDFKIAQALCRKTCREAKKTSFKNYVSKINNKTPMTKIWKMIKKMKGTYKESINHIKKHDGNFAESEKDVADEIGKTFSKNSSSSNYNQTFQKIKLNEEKKKLDFSTEFEEKYNKEFSMKELNACISELSLTTSGPDEIHNSLLKHLPKESLILLLDLFNTIWREKHFPETWRKATIIPIPKPGKDHTNPSNYRPIALTSCLCKLIEKLVNKRLAWYLETKHKLSNYQCGFRKTRSTLDHLIRLETFIRQAFIRGEHMVAVFFDLEKAFDTTWKHGILRDLHGMGLRGNLPEFIKNFLEHRSFQVKVGSELSDPYTQEEGVPQGSILSPLLFEIKMNSIIDALKSNVDCSLYVDDFLVCYKSKSGIETIERQLQMQLNKLEKWANDNGFKFSPSKTQVVHFCCKTSCVREPELTLYGERIEVKNEARFLGVIFDKKLTFIAHLKDLRLRCQKALNALKIFCSPEWGGDTEILLQLYRSLIRSKLDYACQVYGSARKSYIEMLDPIQNQGLRLALGAYRTSPVKSLEAEAHELPLYLRRKKLSLQYAIKISSTPENPAHNCIFDIPDDIVKTTSKKEKSIKPFGLRIAKDLEEIKFSNKDTENCFFSKIPSWDLEEVTVDLDLTQYSKSTTEANTYYKAYYGLMLTKYKEFERIFTDGSKSETAVGSAAVPMEYEIDEVFKRIPSNASIYTAEATALDMALDTIKKSNKSSFVILSDSLSCLVALKAYETLDPKILKLKIKIHSLIQKGKTIVFTWIPSHVGIEGNDMADELAKQTLSAQKISKIKLSHSDFRHTMRKYVLSIWEEDWKQQTNNKLFSIKPKLQPRKPLRLTRRDCVVFTRLKIGHSPLTHQYLLTKDEKPFCVGCQKDFTIKHILTECSDFNEIRRKYFRCTKIKDIFDVVEERKILDFIKEIGLYKRI